MNSQLELDQLKTELRQYPENHQPESQYGERRKLVLDLLDEIAFLREQKYSYKEISRLLHQKTDLLIQPGTLRRYFFEERAKLRGKSSKRKRSKPPTRKKSKARSASKKASQPKADEAPVTAAQAEPKPKPEPQLEPETHEFDDSVSQNWEDDDSYTTGLVNEPTFNRIRRR